MIEACEAMGLLVITHAARAGSEAGGARAGAGNAARAGGAAMGGGLCQEEPCGAAPPGALPRGCDVTAAAGPRAARHPSRVLQLRQHDIFFPDPRGRWGRNKHPLASLH